MCMISLIVFTDKCTWTCYDIYTKMGVKKRARKTKHQQKILVNCEIL